MTRQKQILVISFAFTLALMSGLSVKAEENSTTTVSASAKEQVFTASNHWEYGYSIYDPNSKHFFSALEQKGVERDAEERAMVKCFDAGAQRCLTSSVTLRACNHSIAIGGFGNNAVVCEAQATVVGFFL